MAERVLDNNLDTADFSAILATSSVPKVSAMIRSGALPYGTALKLLGPAVLVYLEKDEFLDGLNRNQYRKMGAAGGTVVGGIAGDWAGGVLGAKIAAAMGWETGIGEIAFVAGGFLVGAYVGRETLEAIGDQYDQYRQNEKVRGLIKAVDHGIPLDISKVPPSFRYLPDGRERDSVRILVELKQQAEEAKRKFEQDPSALNKRAHAAAVGKYEQLILTLANAGEQLPGGNATASSVIINGFAALGTDTDRSAVAYFYSQNRERVPPEVISYLPTAEEFKKDDRWAFVRNNPALSVLMTTAIHHVSKLDELDNEKGKLIQSEIARLKAAPGDHRQEIEELEILFAKGIGSKDRPELAIGLITSAFPDLLIDILKANKEGPANNPILKQFAAAQRQPIIDAMLDKRPPVPDRPGRTPSAAERMPTLEQLLNIPELKSRPALVALAQKHDELRSNLRALFEDADRRQHDHRQMPMNVGKLIDANMHAEATFKAALGALSDEDLAALSKYTRAPRSLLDVLPKLGVEVKTNDQIKAALQAVSGYQFLASNPDIIQMVQYLQSDRRNDAYLHLLGNTPEDVLGALQDPKKLAAYNEKAKADLAALLAGIMLAGNENLTGLRIPEKFKHLIETAQRMNRSDAMMIDAMMHPTYGTDSGGIAVGRYLSSLLFKWDLKSDILKLTDADILELKKALLENPETAVSPVSKRAGMDLRLKSAHLGPVGVVLEPAQAGFIVGQEVKPSSNDARQGLTPTVGIG